MAAPQSYLAYLAGAMVALKRRGKLTPADSQDAIAKLEKLEKLTANETEEDSDDLVFNESRSACCGLNRTDCQCEEHTVRNYDEADDVLNPPTQDYKRWSAEDRAASRRETYNHQEPVSNVAAGADDDDDTLNVTVMDQAFWKETQRQQRVADQRSNK